MSANTAGKIISSFVPQKEAEEKKKRLIEELQWARQNGMPKSEVRLIFLKLQALEGHLPTHETEDSDFVNRLDPTFDSELARENLGWDE